jgi:hypothetical protein
VVAAIVGALVAGIVGYFQLVRPAAAVDKKRHRAAVVAVLEELRGVEHVVNMMLTDGSVKDLPASDVAYRAVAPELLRGLPDDLVALVVKAYIHMQLVVDAVEFASRPTSGRPSGRLPENLARQLRVRAEDLAPAIDGLTLHLQQL